MGAALKPLADASTLLLSYAQIVSSLLVALPRVEWPEPFASIARVLGVFALDLSPLFSLDAVGDSVGVRGRVTRWALGVGRGLGTPGLGLAASPNPHLNPNPSPNPN